MKHAYFTPENIRQKSEEMLQELGDLRKVWSLDLQKSALLVLDMQEYFLNSDSHAFIPSGESIIPEIQQLAAAFEEAGRPVVFTRHINTPEDAGAMSRWWRDVITENHPLSRITDALDTSRGFFLQKSQYDAFYNTELEMILKENGATQVVITGVMTHLCCETTARSAFVRGYDVFFTIDGTATYNEDYHRATLMNLSHGFATPVLAESILAKF
jgi:bifunctional isochorismate lyase/aryl carrier protein